MREWLRRGMRAAAIIAAGVLVAAPHGLDRASAQPEYALYYSFDVPLSILGLALSDDGTKRTYNGTFRGTLGGISITEARYTYANGASERAGGGTFTMTTKAGAVSNGHILMTSDGKQTTLLFFGTYLGTRLSFSLAGPGEQFGGSGVTNIGLAETTFPSHAHYIQAIREAATALPPTARDQLLAQAEQNPRLVREYQQRSVPR